MKPAAHFLLSFALMLAIAATWVRADGVVEAELKAAFVYNFLQLVDWPPEAGSHGNANLVLCSLGDSGSNGAFTALIGRPVGSRKLNFLVLASEGEVASCDALFIADRSVDRLPRLLAELQGRPVLTLADFDAAAERGVMIGLKRVDSRLGFEVNLQAARASGLRVSAKLLRLAAHVYGS